MEDATTDVETDETVDDTETDQPETTDAEDVADTSESDDTDTDDTSDGEDDLGDAGKQALRRMKESLKEERRKRREAEAKLTADDDQADPKIAEALQKANDRIIRSEVKAQAAGKLADPMDAHRFLDLASFEVDDDGNVDEGEIADAIDDLIKEKPYLAAQGGRRFKGSADGGARKEARPKQVSRAELARMTPEQINQAREAGRLNDLMGFKH